MMLPILFTMLAAVSPVLAATGPLDPTTGVPAWETVERHCDYHENEGRGMTYQGPCQEYLNYKTGEQSVSFKGRKFRIEEYKPDRRNPPWMFLMINGRPAAAYALHRSWVSYTPMDVKYKLDVCGEADQFGSCQ